jgi:acetyl-CoA C-acetyltransferase
VGFCEKGQGPRLAIDGEIQADGRIPIATRGGLKARGHPVGATGMYQLVEVIQQLRARCGRYSGAGRPYRYGTKYWRQRIEYHRSYPWP